MRRAVLAAAALAVAAGAVAVVAMARQRGGAPPTPAASGDAAETAEPRLAAATPSKAAASEPSASRSTEIAGIVVDAEGRPVPRVHLTAVVDLEPSRPGRMLSEPRGIAISDEAGRFAVRGLTPGPYVLEARGEGVVPSAMRAETGVEARFQVVGKSGLPTVSLRVLDADGYAVRGARVTILDGALPGGRVQDATDRDGRARFDVPPLRGVQGLDVRPPSDRPDVMPLRGEWTPRVEEVRLERGFVIRGRVVDVEGKPVARADVFFVSGQPADTTDKEGRFEIRRLPAGAKARLSARPSWVPDPAADSATVEAVAGDREVVLVVDPGLDLVVRVEGAGEARALQAIAERETEGGAYVHEQSITRDVATFRGLRRDATYAVWVPPGRDRAVGAYATGLRASQGSVTLRLAPTRSVDGRLLGDGTIEQGHVFLRAPAVHADAPVEPDGSFRVAGLPDTRLRLFASVFLRGDSWVATGDVAAVSRVELSLKYVPPSPDPRRR